MFTRCIFLLYFLVLNVQVNGQNGIQIKAFHTGDSVILRFAPENYDLWAYGASQGYNIRRYDADEYMDLQPEEIATKGTIVANYLRPEDKDDSVWIKLKDKYAPTLLLHSTLFSGKNSAGQMKDEEKSVLFSFCMKICDDHPAAAQAAGLFFIDKSVQPGKMYVYRVEYHSPDPLHKEYYGSVIADEKLSVLQAPDSLYGAFGNRKAVLSFRMNSREYMAGWIVERSVDSIHFERVNRYLISCTRTKDEEIRNTVSFEDSLPTNNVNYWYRVKGLSFFGITSEASPAIKGQGRPIWNCIPVLDTIVTKDHNTAAIHWQYINTDEKRWKKTVLKRSSNVSGPYTEIAEVTNMKTTFITDTLSEGSHYYQILCISADDDTTWSYPYLVQTIDSIPPPLPEKFHASVDSMGLVTLRWNEVHCTDLRGYRVFRANDLKDEFIEITDSVITSNILHDTLFLNTVTKKVYYSICSVDKRWNNSAHSSPLSVDRPDTIAPSAPVFTSVIHTDSSIQLQWKAGNSKDVQRIELRRSSNGKKITLLTFSAYDTTRHYIDTALADGQKVKYEINCTDSSGNSSASTTTELEFRPSVIPWNGVLKATVNREERNIILDWNNIPSHTDRILLYKGKKGESLRNWKTTEPYFCILKDTQLNPGNDYIYGIRFLLKDGRSTAMTTIEVKY